MLTIYLACLIFGGLILIVSIFASTDSDAGGADGHEFDHVDASGHPDIGGNGHSHGEGMAEAVKFFSLRNAVFFIAFFGLTGTVLSVLGISTLLSLPSAVVLGLFAGSFSYYLLSYVARTESGTNPTPNLVGLRARVLVPLSRDSRGKVVVDVGDQLIQVLARVGEEASVSAFHTGETVVILGFEEGTALVAEETIIR